MNHLQITMNHLDVFMLFWCLNAMTCMTALFFFFFYLIHVFRKLSWMSTHSLIWLSSGRWDSMMRGKLDPDNNEGDYEQGLKHAWFFLAFISHKRDWIFFYLLQLGLKYMARMQMIRHCSGFNEFGLIWISYVRCKWKKPLPCLSITKDKMRAAIYYFKSSIEHDATEYGWGLFIHSVGYIQLAYEKHGLHAYLCDFKAGSNISVQSRQLDFV